MIHKFEKLNRFWFVTFLVLLLFNDFYLKFALHNWFTGKLSDFAGLFIFPYFFTSIFNRDKKLIYVLTGIIFIYWKSPFSEDFILIFSSYFFKIDRIIDYSDLIALLILPISYQYLIKNDVFQLKLNPMILVIISSFSFMATSLPPRTQVQFGNIDKTYTFNCSKNELKLRLAKNYSYNKKIINIVFSKYFISNKDIENIYLPQGISIRKNNFDKFENEIQNAVKDTLNLEFYRRKGYKYITSKFLVSGDSLNSQLRLIVIDATIPLSEENKFNKSYYLEEIEKKFIIKLNKK